MNGYSFTEDVRHMLAQAREQAVELGHDQVRPEHLFLALLVTPCAIVADVFKAFRVDPSELHHDVRAAAGARHDRSTGSPDLPYSSRAKQVLEFAMHEAHALRHTYVGGEHLLLGLLKEGQSARGITVDAARAEILRSLGEDKVATGFEWLSELGTLTRQLGDSLADVKHPRTPEDLLLVVVSDDGGARHILEVSGVTIDGLKREVLESAEAIRGPKSLREFIHAAKNEQQFLGDCALASHHLLLAYLALRPAHGYRALSERGVTHASVRSIAEKIFG